VDPKPTLAVTADPRTSTPPASAASRSDAWKQAAYPAAKRCSRLVWGPPGPAGSAERLGGAQLQVEHAVGRDDATLAELTIEAFLPADPATRELLERNCL